MGSGVSGLGAEIREIHLVLLPVQNVSGLFAATGLERAPILNYGCGSGDITFPMLQSGHAVTGIDISHEMLRKASERAQQFEFTDRATYHHFDAEVFSRISPESFDVVVCSSVLEYVEDDRSLLRVFHKVIKDGGFLLVSVPDKKSLYCKLDRWLYAKKRFLPRFILVEKLRYLDIQRRQYDIELFIQELEATGFELKAKKYNTISLQRGAIMEKFSNIPGIGMLAILMFRKRLT